MSERKKVTINCTPIGSRVKIGTERDPIDGIVTGICLKGISEVTYEVAWWNGGNRCTAWLTPEELIADGDETLTIGFHAEFCK